MTSGAASDIEQATKLARMMVTRWGLSAELGTVAYGENQDEVFLGYRCRASRTFRKRPSRRSTPRSGGWSRTATPRRTRSSPSKRADLEMLAKGLLEFETLTGDEIKDLLNGKPPVRESVIEPAGAALFGGAARGQAASASGCADDWRCEPQPQG